MCTRVPGRRGRQTVPFPVSAPLPAWHSRFPGRFALCSLPRSLPASRGAGEGSAPGVAPTSSTGPRHFAFMKNVSYKDRYVHITYQSIF